MSIQNKISKHPHYDDPTAFGKHFPRIEKTEGGTAASVLLGAPEQRYKMGAIRAVVAPPTPERPFYFMSIHGRDRYPTWDEVVWLRYNLIPDAAVMALLLPNLNGYINKEDDDRKYVFTMEQVRWSIDPPVLCERCGDMMMSDGIALTTAVFRCEACAEKRTIDVANWNEEHGNGFLARR
ncbi:MAG: hypothetical protein IPK17_38620 [Chloroflexi bacterium]|uniref:hypothetical protein n=1 Tax=Candidatus Flexifilum breve TaxID=3140694 RepID=UPI0031347FEC|nr:hypothetical protein [Chloroflexota bacterium]